MRSSRPEEGAQDNEDSNRLLIPSHTQVSKLSKKKQMRDPSSSNVRNEEEPNASHFSKISEDDDDTTSIKLSSYARRPLTAARQAKSGFGSNGLSLSFIKTSHYSYFIIVMLSVTTIVQTARLNNFRKGNNPIGDGRKNLRTPNTFISSYGDPTNSSNHGIMSNYGINSTSPDFTANNNMMDSGSNSMFGSSTNYMPKSENGMVSIGQEQNTPTNESTNANSVGMGSFGDSNSYATGSSGTGSYSTNSMMQPDQGSSSSSSYGSVNSGTGMMSFEQQQQQQNFQQDQTMQSASATSYNSAPSNGESTQFGMANSNSQFSTGTMNTGTSAMGQQPAYGSNPSLNGDSSNTMGMNSAPVTSDNSMVQNQMQSSYGNNPAYPTGSSGTASAGMMQSENQMASSPTGATTSMMGSQGNTMGAYGSNVNGMMQQQQQSQTGSYAQPASGSQQPQSSGYVDPNGQVVEDSQFELPSFELIELSNFKDTWDARESSDLPVFFRIPHTGADVIEKAMRSCHRFIVASEGGIDDGHGAETQISIVNIKVESDTIPSRFVNIDTTSSLGIERAVQLNFANANLADVVMTPFIYEANDLLKDNPSLMGRFFATFRHPIERAAIAYEAAKASDPEVAGMTLEQYAGSPKVENNYLTRQLSRQLSGDLNEDHVKLALEVIRRKFLVGLGTFPKASIFRFERFFTWIYRVNPTQQEQCREAIFESAAADVLVEQGNAPGQGSPVWDMLAFHNQFDLQLYGYIESLWKEQEQFVEGVDEDIRKTAGTCCECDPPTLPPEGFLCPITSTQ